jgi:hypothetical protein
LDSLDKYFEGIVEPVSGWLISGTETLIKHSSLQEIEKDELINELEKMTKEELEALNETLYNIQTCPIESGRNYSQTDIKYKLKKMLKND